MSTINTIIADCQTLMIEGLSAIFDSIRNPSIKVTATANNSADLLKKVNLGGCDLLIMDINFPGEDGIELIPTLKSFCPNMRVIVLTTYTDRKFVKRAFLNGTDGYVLKSNHSLDLIQCTNTVMEAETYMSE